MENTSVMVEEIIMLLELAERFDVSLVFIVLIYHLVRTHKEMIRSHRELQKTVENNTKAINVLFKKVNGLISK